MRISLGPILYFWPRDRVLAFYREVQSLPVDIVYLGEAVCAKRRELRPDDWLEVARTLQHAGKEVVLTTLALVEAASELSALRRLCDSAELLVEANDLAAVQRLAAARRPFVAGSSLNLYNPRSLGLLRRQGMVRWVPPVDLSRHALAALLENLETDLETELFAYGRLPLAYSARCYTARAYDLPKDRCGFRCLDHPDGLPLQTQEGMPFLTLNGIQTLSAEPCNLLGQWPDLRALGVDVLRVSPTGEDTADRLRALRAALDSGPGEAAPAALTAGPALNGYWSGAPGMLGAADADPSRR